MTIDDLHNKCADVNYLKGSIAPFSKTLIGNYYIEHTKTLGYSVAEVISDKLSKEYGREVIHRIQMNMTKNECYHFLLGIEYALINIG